MSRSKNKKKPIKRTKDKFANVEVDPEVSYYQDLVYKVRESKNKAVVNEAFEKIVSGLESKIKKIAGKFRIPGHTFDDIYQECLIALRMKAIKDYDENKGSDPTKPAPFDRFALLCIRRHLSTALKSSNGNKIKVINECKSLEQDRSTDNSEMSLIEIICSKDKDVSTLVQDKEMFSILMKKLMKKLSPLEVIVLRLYAQQYTYAEIADIIIKNKLAKSKDIADSAIIDKKNKTKSLDIEQVKKGVDNALSRIKIKAKLIIDKMQKRK